MFFAFLPQFFFVEYLCLLLSFCFIPWLIFPTYRVFLKIIITNVGFFSSFSHSALKKLIRNFFLPYFHKKNKISCCCLLTCFFVNLQATFFYSSLGITFWPRGRDGREHWHEKYIWKTSRDWSWSAIIWRVFNQSCHFRSHHALLLALWLSTCVVRISNYRI